MMSERIVPTVHQAQHNNNTTYLQIILFYLGSTTVESHHLFSGYYARNARCHKRYEQVIEVESDLLLTFLNIQNILSRKL
jgi:hypothetical protein